MALRLASRQARLVVFGYNALTEKISWVRNPEVPQYAGSRLSLRGSQVMAYYKDGTMADVTDVCGYDPEAGTLLEYGGELIISANYTDHAGNNFTADTRIEISDVEKLLFTGLAHPIQKEGGILDLSGAVLTARYTDGTSRTVDASSVTFEPKAGGAIGHCEKGKLPVTAEWKNPATGRNYTAEYVLQIDNIKGVAWTYAPAHANTYGFPLDLEGSRITLSYDSGEELDVTGQCVFYPAAGEILHEGTEMLTAVYRTAAGDEYSCEIGYNAQSIPIEEIGCAVGSILGLEFTVDLPDGFWDDFGAVFINGTLDDGSYYISSDDFGNIVQYLDQRGAFDKYERNGNVKFLKVPKGTYYSKDGQHSVTAKSDLYFVAAVKKVRGNPPGLLPSSAVEYPYTNKSTLDQCYVFNFTMSGGDLTEHNPIASNRAYGGILGSLNGYVHMKPAGLIYPERDYNPDVYSDNTTQELNNLVIIPGILNLPWVWYEDIPASVDELRRLVYGAEHEDGTTGIKHKGPVPSLTYSKASVFAEVKEQFPDLFVDDIPAGDHEIVPVPK